MFSLYRDAHKEAKRYELGSLRKNIQKLLKRTAIEQKGVIFDNFIGSLQHRNLNLI
jgi:hypothetical protein